MARGIKSLHPIILFIYYLAMMIWIIVIKHPLFLVLSLLLLTLLNLLLDGGNKMSSWRRPIIVMAVFILIATPLFNQRGTTVLFYLFNNPVVLESVLLGIQIALQFINLILLVVTLPLMFPTNHFLYLFAQLSPQWALLLMLGIRFIPSLKNQIQEMQEVQQLKVTHLKESNWLEKSRHLMQLIKTLLTNALESSIQVADSMTARGYSYGERTYYHTFNLKLQDYSTIFVFISTNLLLILGFTQGYLTAGVYDLLGQDHQWTFLLIWLLLTGLPLLIEGKEWVKWQYLQSKI